MDLCMIDPFHLFPWRRFLAPLVVVFFTVDVLARSIEILVQILALAAGQHAVRLVLPLFLADGALLAGELFRFASGEFAGAHTLANAVMLLVLAGVDAGIVRPGQCGAGGNSEEFALLKVLVNHPRQPLSRDRLMELARGRDHEAFDHTIDVQVSRLRKLIEPDAAKPRYIQAVWGHG
jgi:hypothetical protein